MPAQRILDALGMTPAQWGALPVDVGPNASDERPRLRKKALEIIAQQDAKAAELQHFGGAALGKRLDNIEASIRGIAGEVNRRFSEMESRLGSAVHLPAGSFDAMAKRLEEAERDIKALENKVKAQK